LAPIPDSLIPCPILCNQTQWDFSNISKPLTNLLQKDVLFSFNDDCVESFNVLKNALISAPIIQPLDWNLPFEIMCDASDYAVGVVLGQRVDKKLNVKYYASKILDGAKKKTMLLLKMNF
jgi:hypothetical protein